MALAQAQLLVAGAMKFQSYWVNQTVDIQFNYPPFDVHYFCDFLPFDSGVIVTTNTGDSETLDVDLPASASIIGLVEKAMRDRQMWTVWIFQFEALSKGTLQPTGGEWNGRELYEGGIVSLDPPGDLTLLAAFSGYIQEASIQGTTIAVQLGSTLSPVGSQVPPRKFTTARVGAPMRL